jgi:hypothetical protein
MLFLDGVYVDNWKGTWFRWVKTPTSAELAQLSQTIARRVGRFLERQGLLERDAEIAIWQMMSWKQGRWINYEATPSHTVSP